MAVQVLQAGILTTLQDVGRFGHRAQGVVTGGAMDSFAHQVSNWLAGNADDCATLEITMGGLQLIFEEKSWIALTGNGFNAFINDTPVNNWSPLLIQAQSLLKIQYTGKGCRAYLAINGGWKADFLLNSYSTYLPGGWGGYKGRPIKKGDRLEYCVTSSSLFKAHRWTIAPSALLPYGDNCLIRVTEGPEWNLFTNDSKNEFNQSWLSILPQSNRMGYRLHSNIRRTHSGEILSTAVCPGTIQVLPDGNLVLLMKDAPATGGYPRIAQVVETDIPLIAQMITGNSLRFTTVTLRQAEEIYLTYQQKMQKLQEYITNRLYQ